MLSRYANTASAFALVVIAARSQAEPIHYWCFEDSPGFLGDSIGTSDITGETFPTQVALPSSGRGGDSPSGSNDKAADFNGSGQTATTTFAGLSGDFTVESFIHADTLAGTFGDTIVASLTQGGTPSLISFGFQIRRDGFGGSQVNDLLLAISDGSTTFGFGSGFIMETGKGYYVAAAFDLAGGEITFFLQNLTDGGPLENASTPHSLLSLQSNTFLMIGGIPNSVPTVNKLHFDGLIDEVRLSDSVLQPSELLISNCCATDTDGDGIPDVDDNCPFVSNSSQTNSDPLPAGDACQCGDVNSDFVVDGLDLQIARENLVGHALSGSFDPDRCNVIGASGCGVDDIFVLDRVAQGLPVSLQNVCDAYSAP